MQATTQRKTLGRGLSSLLDDISEEVVTPRAGATTGTTLPLDVIVASEDQPRKFFDEDALQELADSIRQKGLIQPILVRPAPERDGLYEIVAGERRWRASQRAKLHEVPVVIRELEDTEALEIALIENVQRSDLNAMEEAFGYRQLIEKYGYSQEELAKNVGKSRPHIANMMRLVNLPDTVQDLVRTGKLSAGHARVVLSASNPEAFAKKCVQGQWSVRTAELMVKKFNEGDGAAAPKARRMKDADTLLLEGDLRAVLRRPVEIKQKNDQSGELRISYRDLEDLEGLCQVLRGEGIDVLATG